MQLIESNEQTWQGIKYSKEYTEFRIFAKGNSNIKLALYDKYDDVYRKEFEMESQDDFFYKRIDGDLEGKFYTYLVGGNEVTDPNSFACSINSEKSAIIDLEKTNPQGFNNHKIPDNKWKEAVIYEVHVADFTASETSGATNRGKFLGMAEENTFFENVSTGLDHLAELGVTHVHLLPIYDFITVDERKSIVEDGKNYNWGYDPELFNCLEGSYSTNPYDPSNRIFEFKYLVQKIHERGMSVVMDVVYNHTYKTNDSNFNVLAPNYYHRNINGNFQNASGCGNEFASEKQIAREFLINSLMFWAREYKIDGFRFDLMAIIDIDTVEEAIKKLREINPNTIIYGEPWMAFTSLLPSDKQITIGAQKGKDFAIFNPFFRDSMRGDNDGESLGYIQGDFRFKPDIEKGIVGSISFDRTIANFKEASESINYFNAHDNLIFQDKLIKSGVSEDLHEKMTIMVFSILMMSQGLPFFHAGNEFLRSKKLDHNSYRSPISVNGIDWSLKKDHLKVFETVRDLIKLRKDLGIFYMTSKEIIENINFFKELDPGFIAYFIKNKDDVYLITHNVSDKTQKLKMDRIKFLDLLWSNGFRNEKVSNVEVKAYTSNVYKIEGGFDEF